MTDDPAAPESLEDVQDEAADTVEDHDSASMFARKEIIQTLKDRFRAKDRDVQRQLLNRYNTMSRRDFLKLLGFTAGSAAVVGSTGWLMGKKVFSDTTDKTITGMQGSGYETIQASGQVIRVNAGETWENKLIDMSTGQHIVVVAKDSNWTIRNIGFDGPDTSGRGNSFFGIADTGNGESLMENVYLGDGASTGNSGSSTGHGTNGIWADPAHNGHITLCGCNVRGMTDNGVYGSAPGSNGNGQRGTIHIDNSVAANNYVSQFRLADGCKITNSVAWNDSSAQHNGRCFWGWPTPAGNQIEIIGCHFDSGPYPGAIHLGRDGRRTLVYMENTQHDGIRERGNVNIEDGGGNGNNPDTSVEVNAPTTAKEAAQGGNSCGEFPDTDGGDSGDGGGSDRDPDTDDGSPGGGSSDDEDSGSDGPPDPDDVEIAPPC